MRAGFYQVDAPNPTAATVTGLDSLIRLGYVRLNGQQMADQMSEIISATVRSHPSGGFDELTRDYNLLTGSEDWNTESGSQDNGTGAVNFVDCDFRLIATVDGNTVFTDKLPELIRFDTQARYFSCSLSGVWHIVEFSAVEPGQSFRIKTLELTVVDAGRLQ